MMNLLVPLGLLALIGILLLILIYILKPNYQQKLISSTYIWKLSLRYQKKKIPISKLRNLLIIICQILIIGAGAFIISRPYISEAVETPKAEKIVIIDASASMLALKEETTRFERAVIEVNSLAQETLNKNGSVSIILAGNPAVTLCSRSENPQEINNVLNDAACTYGVADINGAMILAEEILSENPLADVILYTATQYTDIGNVNLVDVSAEEWNAAVLNCTPVLEENYYNFEVVVASYNKEMDMLVYLQIDGANYDEENPEGETMLLQQIATCIDDKKVTVTFSQRIYSYISLQAYIMENDSFSYDNSLFVNGGKKEVIKVLYASSAQNNFVRGMLMGLREDLKNRWDIVLTEGNLDDDLELKGYDFYIFEHQIPNGLPSDGIVFLLNPIDAPRNSGLNLGNLIVYNGTGDGLNLSASSYSGNEKKIMNFVKPEEITVSAYRRVVSYDGYQPLMYCGNDPVLLLKNEIDTKIIVMPFSMHYSNLALSMSFPILLYNIFDFFFPPTVTSYVFDVDQTINLNARGWELNVSGPGLNKTINSFPDTVSLPSPGAYTLTQMLLSDREVVENIYVRIAATESDFTRIETFVPPYIQPVPLNNLDLLLYFAIAMTAFLMTELLLYIQKEQI